MELLSLLYILHKLNGSKHALSCEVIQLLLSSREYELLLLHRQLLARVHHHQLQLLLIIGFVEVHERLKVIQITLILGVENLILIMLHLNVISEFGEFAKEFIALFFLNLKLAILDIKVEDFPDVVGSQFWNELVLAVLGYERNV